MRAAEVTNACRGAMIELVGALCTPSERPYAAAALARELGVDAILILVRDPVLGALLPAPGMPQTLRAGRTWRQFVAGCPTRGRCAGTVELPKGTHRPVLAVLRDGTAVMLLGGTPVEAAVRDLEQLLPLVCALLAAEQEGVLARAHAATANEAASRAETLAQALEAARADASALNADLREEQSRKDEFLAMLGHELRNPLSPLVASIEFLRRQDARTPVPASLINIMARQTVQLTRLVDDLLDISRVSRGKIALKREPVLLGSVIADATEDSRVLIEARQHRIIVHGADVPLEVNGDRARLVQVFGNLLNNAAKYTDPGGTITMTMSRRDNNAVVTLEDTGIGIAPDVQPRIFDLFAQAPTALGRAQGGLGIGLTLVRTLVELHGGRVSVSSRGTGLGSTFSVVLPIVQGAMERPDAAGPAAATIARLDPLRVLIVDDNRDAADTLAGLLRMMGHHAHVAYDGSSAFDLAPHADADLIFLDIGLPGMDGFEVARKLRPLAKPRACFIALTGYGTEQGTKRSTEAGFDRHVVKPITIEVLDEVVRDALSGRT